MGRYFGREPRYTREEIERQAQETLEARVSMGRPPAEDWAPIEARLAEMDREMAARAPAEAVPAPPPPRKEEPQPLAMREVRLPAGSAKAGGATRAAAAPSKPRAARRPVATKGRAG